MRSETPFLCVSNKHCSAVLNFAVQITLCIVCLWLLGSSASAQVNGQGTLSGTVADPTGAVVVGAQVTITNVATGVSYSKVTNSTGYFETDNLNPGTYKVSVISPGFTNLVRAGIILEADARLNIPLKLNPGATATITVSTENTQLNTETASFGQVLTTKQVQDLTVSGSNPTWLALIAPGTQANVSQAASTGDGGGLIWSGLTQDFGTMGQIGKNEFSLDGAPNMTGGRQIAMNQSPDSIGEMKMDVNGYDASIGHTLGVNVTATTKGGTNKLHGSVREAYTDTRWQGLNSIQGRNYKYLQSQIPCPNGATTNAACYNLENKSGNPGTNANNADASLGGPVYIPGLIKGRNKFFFFVSGIVDNFAGAGGGSATLPTTPELTGNFADYPTTTPPAGFIAGTTSSKGVQGTCPTGTPYYGQYQLYNPYSTVIDSAGVPRRTPLCGNMIPSNLLTNSAMTKFYNSVIPSVTVPSTGSANYAYTSITPQTFRDITTREDWKINSKNDVFARYAWQRYTKTTNSPLAGNLGREAEDRYIQLASIGWNYTINDRTNLNVTLSGTGYKNTCCYYPGFDALNPSTLGLPSYTGAYAQATDPGYLELPVLSINSYAGIGNNGSPTNDSRDFRLSGDITHVAGRHTIRAGAEGRLQNYSQIINGSGTVGVNGQNISTGVSGSYAFDNTYTQENNGSDSNFSQSNFALSYAAFLMGVHTNAAVALNAPQSFHSPYYGIYGDDTWRVTPRLTLVPGLRFELEDGLVEKHNQQIVGWDPNADLSLISGPANAAYAATLAAATPAQVAVLPTSLTIKGGPMYAGVNGNPSTAYVNSYRFMPRLGATYQLNRRMVLRAGYGLFFDTLNALNATNGGTTSSLADQDGFSTSTSVPSSTTFGTNFTPGVSPLSDPFPANAGGARFNTPVGSSAAQYYYLGAGPTITDHALTPARENRGSIGVQIAFDPHTVLDVSYNIARTTNLTLNKNNAYTPQNFYSGGQQTNSATATLLGQLVPNPFYIGNFSSLAGSNPAAYSVISHSSYYTSKTISVGNLVRAYPQMSGFTEREPLGSSNFQEVLFALTHRMSHGVSLTASFEVNDQHDKDFFWNAFDPLPTSEPSNSSEPTRFTMEEVWQLPFGKGNPWANSGWKNALFGGFQIDTSYELQPGQLVNFNNLFYEGNATGSAIKLASPVWNMPGPQSSDYIQWLNPGNVTATFNAGTCTYSGTGFVTNSQCQPNAYNFRVFPTRVNGVRAMGMNNVNGNVARTFHLWENMNLETTFLVYNVFNHQGFGGPNASPTNGNFGRVTGDGFPQAGARWVYIQGRLQF
ncbi:MAG TPA: carboxypeptidase-like regulatory domain-containing protein [Bryobacteraceae bacterium]